jgi:hypothetical protein
MIVLDEDVPESQRPLLRRNRLRFRQISHDIGRMGMTDAEVISLLHQLDRPTFFTLDQDFYNCRLCHERYCLVFLDVFRVRVAEYVRRFLRHRDLNTKAKRMGRVIPALPTGLAIWRIHQEQEGHFSWP